MPDKPELSNGEILAYLLAPFNQKIMEQTRILREGTPEEIEQVKHQIDEDAANTWGYTTTTIRPPTPD